MKFPTPEAQCAEGVFQIQSPICGVNFSNNISITQVRVNERETELDSTFETSEPLTSPLHDLIIGSHVKHLPINLLEKVYSPMQSFFKKKFPPYLVGGRGDTMLYLHIFSHL